MAVSCGVGLRHGSDLALLWLWHRPAATALIRPLAWEPPYAVGEAQRNSKKTKKKEIETRETIPFSITLKRIIYLGVDLLRS